MTTLHPGRRWLAVLLLACATMTAVKTRGDGPAAVLLPTIPAEHRHARMLAENALRYLDPALRLTDPNSGYPYEGYNDEPKRQFFLRSFTQLTAIGQWLEAMGSVVAGDVRLPWLSPEQAMASLERVVKTLRQDQADPQLSSRGLLGNFLDLSTGKRLGPLAGEVKRDKFVAAFGEEKATAIWEALKAKGWLKAKPHDREAAVFRGERYGWNHFDGPLAPFVDPPTRQKVMSLLDQRTLLVVFGDNANLSTSAAKTIGALLAPAVANQPPVVRLREELERFLDDQQAGYLQLYNRDVGLFYFGYDVGEARHFGWEDQHGRWRTGHMDYLINEFRGPAAFVVLRYGLPLDAIKNLGFKMKSYRTEDGRELYALAPWEGSAFQALGLSVGMSELDNPSWRRLLRNVVEIEIDYARRRGLPGFLSESYTGEDHQYTGDVGIAEIAVATGPRITTAASLYTLGPAYMVAPDQVEAFLASAWPKLAPLLTDHGPWEGLNSRTNTPIAIQTTAHTLTLGLGLLGVASQHKQRYLQHRKLAARLPEIYPAGAKVDLCSPGTQIFAWGDEKASIESRREAGGFRVTGRDVQRLGIAFVPEGESGMNISGGRLRIGYRAGGGLSPVILALKSTRGAPPDNGLISQEITLRLADTAGAAADVEVPLPATPGLTTIREAVLTYEDRSARRPIDLVITGFSFAPDSAP